MLWGILGAVIAIACAVVLILESSAKCVELQMERLNEYDGGW